MISVFKLATPPGSLGKSDVPQDASVTAARYYFNFCLAW